LNKSKGQVSKKAKISRARNDSDDDRPPPAKAKPKPKPKPKPKVSPEVKKTSSPIVKKKPVKQDSDSDDEVPLAHAKAHVKSAKRVKPESDSDDPLAAKSKKVKKEPKSTPKANGIKRENPSSSKGNGKSRVKSEDAETKEEEEDEEYRWWEAAAGENDGTKKWTTLEHNGVLFPPPYEPLPKHVKMKYDGQEVSLPPEAEEVAGFFAALIESDHGSNPVFQQNFFNDWLAILKKHKVVVSSVGCG
jgi:DNA topoisomerase I